MIVQDADLEYDPDDYLRLHRAHSSGPGRRGVRLAVPAMTRRRVLYFWHSLANRALTTLSNMFTNLNLTDMETCYKVFRREVIQAIAPRLKQQRFGIRTGADGQGGPRRPPDLRGERSVTTAAPTTKAKKIGWRDGLKALWCIVRYWKWD